MDIVLRATDDYFFTPYVYPQSWQRDDIWRQIISLSLIVNIGGYLLYIIPTTLDYLFIFDKSLMKHPQFMKDQVKLEIFYASKSIPLMGALTTIVFLFEVRGYSKLYDNWNDTPYGVFGMGLSILSFMFFNDMMIYWIHRFLHYRWFYKYIHKDHHKWKIPSPFASHAFHPIDGFLQSTPYHIYPFLFPLHKATYLLLFISCLQQPTLCSSSVSTCGPSRYTTATSACRRCCSRSSTAPRITSTTTSITTTTTVST
ncbi:PREDICTED: lathosterol oxidase-like isoform X2 [Priapulus caudatus]|uniref:Lathosterol oxidase-like isoform X2 n=1 Tax=Priapulus caudatus TaxID=37621 RepID=A0ABM1DN66_PRICU|nr:PREDICTED: lathosterol oxidase-like isoform X2 [Priapulus caudatus]